MALDKQKILNDLGSVMNQLQSADCGCMGKLFNQGQGQGQFMQPQGFGGCCRRGYGHPCCGEPYSIGEGMPAHGRPCMSYCNAPKLYADGYNYLNQNVMQPVIKEVYEDLRSLNAGNTVTNNPLGAKMGLTPGVPTLPSDGNMNPNAQMANMNANPGGQGMPRGHPMMQHMQNYQMTGGQQMTGGMQMPGGQQMAGGQEMAGGQQMAGGQLMSGGQQMLGEQQMTGGQQMTRNTQGLANFTKMFPGITQGEGGGLSFNPMEIAMQMNPALGKQQPGMGAISSQQPGMGAMSNQQPGMGAMSNQPPGVDSMSNPQDLNNAAVTGQPGQMQQQVYSAGTPNQLPGNFPPQGMNPHMGRMNANQGGQGGNYGQHTPGMTKFKEMFPGVMDGDINFDPMEIAIQMNPANKQAAVMNTMQKLMSAKPLEANSAVMKPVMNGMNAVNASLAPNQVAPGMQAQPGQAPGQVPPEQEQYANQPADPQQANQQYTTNQVPPNQQYTTNQVQPNQHYAANPATSTNQLQPPQQVYTAYTDNQGNQQVPQSVTEQNYQKNETPPPMSQGYPNQVPGGRVYEREPIFPADNSRYNTIGQPIELQHARKYHTPEPNLPQTLSPQRVSSRLRVNNNIRSTISKTSLFGRQGGGQRTPSRAQLQQVYNQYKGSQSYTNQNIPNRDPRGQTTSDGRLTAAAPVMEKNQIPVERVGGDTMANNQVINEPVKGHPVGQIGDVSNNPAPGNADVVKTKSGNLRNGLQDMVYTSYPRSTAWSFHGRSDQHYAPRYIRA